MLPDPGSQPGRGVHRRHLRLRRPADVRHQLHQRRGVRRGRYGHLPARAHRRAGGAAGGEVRHLRAVQRGTLSQPNDRGAVRYFPLPHDEKVAGRSATRFQQPGRRSRRAADAAGRDVSARGRSRAGGGRPGGRARLHRDAAPAGRQLRRLRGGGGEPGADRRRRAHARDDRPGIHPGRARPRAVRRAHALARPRPHRPVAPHRGRQLAGLAVARRVLQRGEARPAADPAGPDRPDRRRHPGVPAEPGVLMARRVVPKPRGTAPGSAARGPARSADPGPMARGPGTPARALLHALLGMAASVGAAAAQVAQDRPYLDPTLPMERRIDDLLARMTLEEKVGQMLCLWQGKRAITDSAGRFDPSRVSDWFRIGIGRIERPGDGHGARAEAEYTNAIQRWVKEHTRLGIPVLFHEEALHGLEGEQATSFPQAIALASTWNPDLVERVFTAAAAEARARGVEQVLAPVVDVARDPRWGRIEETYGEDPYLAARMGVAAVRGFQGGDTTVGPSHVLATLKHMTGHGQPESGTNVGPAPYGERTLRDVFLYPFEVVIK